MNIEEIKDKIAAGIIVGWIIGIVVMFAVLSVALSIALFKNIWEAPLILLGISGVIAATVWAIIRLI